MSCRRVLAPLALTFVLVTGSSMTLFVPLLSRMAPDGLEKYVDALPIPPRLVVPPGQTDVTVTLNAFSAKLHRDLPAQIQWGYNGTTPGPTIEVERDQRVRIHWKNELPTTHLFPVAKGAEPTLGGMGSYPGIPDAVNCAKNPLPDVRAITHLHGAVVSESDPMDRLHNSDGWPDAWNVPGQEQIAEYPNPQAAMTLWYHDHAMMTTGRNVAAGLLGMYEIHDDYERSLNLPTGDYDIPLMLISKGVGDDGKLFYTDDITAEFWGNAPSVNGKLWPYLTVEPRKYRFRVLNASNARAYTLKLVDAADGETTGPAFYQIGSDGGFLEDTAVIGDATHPESPTTLSLMPAERADIIVDFSAYAGRTFTLSNGSRTADDEETLPEIMQFRVGMHLKNADTSSLPFHLRTVPRLDPSTAIATRRIVFDRKKLGDGTVMLEMNGKRWSDPVEEKPVLGTTEIWELADTLIDPHPFHMHQVQFQILDRRLFDVAEFLKSGQVVYLADARLPAENERGWKDTVKMNPQMITRIIVKFGPNPGHFVYHCHILEHEDMDMMRPFDIVSPPSP
jgi:spore coat protein A